MPRARPGVETAIISEGSLPVDIPSEFAGSVVSLLARAGEVDDQVAAICQRAGAAAGATTVVLLEIDDRSGRLRETLRPHAGAPAAPGWLDEPASAALTSEVLASGRVRQVILESTTTPALARRLGTPAAVLAPVLHAGHPLGLLLLGLPGVLPALEWSGRVVECADGLAVALADARRLRREQVQRRLASLVVELGRSGTPWMTQDRFERFCVDAARAMPADRVDVWLHDRRGETVNRVASSDTPTSGGAASVPASDPSHVVAETLRRPRARLLGTPLEGAAGCATVAVPLQGRRRALGVLVVDGLGLPAADIVLMLDLLDGIGHLLANVIESAQLLDDVLRTRRELENSFDSMRDLVFVCRHDGRMAHVNRAAAYRLGRQRDALIGQPVAMMVGPALAAWLTTPPEGQIDHAMPRTTELDDELLGGTFVVTVTPVVDPSTSRPGSVVVVRDVSDDRRVEAERANLRDRLARSEAMGQLVAGIAHELNNPLQAVLGQIELLQRAHRFPAPVAGPLRLVCRESERAARIVRNLLVLAGPGQMARRPISVNSALRRALALRAKACRSAKIAIVRRLTDSIPTIAGDTVLLQQAFLNLLINAEQALDARPGRIEVTTSYSARRKQVSVVVKDSGPGIAPDVLPQIFEPFFTTKDAGSGLGLAMTLRIITEHGGEVAASSKGRGHGAVFTVHLPTTSSSKR
ncbi:MAG: ATP-binding protein [Acidobacteriota bacterium]